MTPSSRAGGDSRSLDLYMLEIKVMGAFRRMFEENKRRGAGGKCS